MYVHCLFVEHAHNFCLSSYLCGCERYFETNASLFLERELRSWRDVHPIDAHLGDSSQLHHRRTARQPSEMGGLYLELYGTRVSCNMLVFVLQLQSCLALGGTHTFDGSSLSDGLTISRCLFQLAPTTFTAEWTEKIIAETGGNWRLKVSLLAREVNTLASALHYGAAE